MFKTTEFDSRHDTRLRNQGRHTGSRRVRHAAAVAAFAAVLASCGIGDDARDEAASADVADDASGTTDPTTADTAPSTPAAPTPAAPTTAAPTSPATTSATPTTAAPTTAPPTTAAPTTVAPTTASPTTDAPTTASPPPATAPPAAEALEQSFPALFRGSWRESESGEVTLAECDQSGPSSVDNFGKVLSIRDDGYNFFESGGRLNEVVARSDDRFEAIFDTSAPPAEEPRLDQLAFDLVEGGAALILTGRQNLDGSDTARYVRCPEESPPSEALEQSFPALFRGSWRESESGEVTLAECDQSGPSSVDNFGKVLSIRDDGYSFFESGGLLNEVVVRSDDRFEATFDSFTPTTQQPNAEQLLFEVVEGGAAVILSGREDIEGWDTTRYARCPEE